MLALSKGLGGVAECPLHAASPPVPGSPAGAAAPSDMRGMIVSVALRLSDQCARIGRCRNMIALDHFRALASLVLQLEGRLEEVGVQPRCRIQTFQHACRLDAIRYLGIEVDDALNIAEQIEL
jgi:hypothetical protein